MSNDITVRIKADAGPLKRGMNDGERAVKSFAQTSDEMARRVAKSSAVVVTAVAAIGAAALKMASEAAAAGIEIRNLATTAGTSTTNFQRMAFASRTVGIEQEKLSDILKDVNDKFGDYMATGAGPLADFFENIAPKIGITAEAFANLSGPDALQLYVSSLEQAGLSQQQMTFYMEALASDATQLLPLLRDNGREMASLGDEAARLGLVLSDQAIAAAAELDQELAVLAQTLKINATAAVLEHKDALVGLINFITETVIPAVSTLSETLGTVALGWKTIAEEARNAVEPITRALGLSAQLPGASESGNVVPPPPAGLPEDTGDTSNTGLFYVDENGNVRSYGDDAETIPGITAPSLPMTMGSPLDPTGGLLPEFSAADRARMAWEAQQELQAEIEEATADHEAELTRIEERAARERELLAKREAAAKKQAMSTLFSDLTSLMQSENDKLFKIGKVAAIAEATVSGYNAAVKAYEGGLRVSGGNPAVGAAFAAASIAKTGMLISQIQSTSKNGGGASTSSSGNATSVAGGADAGGGASPTTTFSFTLQNDPMGFGESFARQMIEQLNEAQRNGSNIRGVLA